MRLLKPRRQISWFRCGPKAWLSDFATIDPSRRPAAQALGRLLEYVLHTKSTLATGSYLRQCDTFDHVEKRQNRLGWSAQDPISPMAQAPSSFGQCRHHPTDSPRTLLRNRIRKKQETVFPACCIRQHSSGIRTGKLRNAVGFSR